MDEFDPTDTTSEMRRRDLFGFLLLALVAGLLIVLAVTIGGIDGD